MKETTTKLQDALQKALLENDMDAFIRLLREHAHKVRRQLLEHTVCGNIDLDKIDRCEQSLKNTNRGIELATEIRDYNKVKEQQS